MELLKEEIKIEEITIKENNQDVKLFYCQNNKFKTFYTRCVFLFDFDYTKKPVYMVLSYLLERSTGKHPIEDEFQTYLCNLYSMAGNVGYGTKGLIDHFTFTAGTINTKYVTENINLFDASLDVLEELITKPNFDEEIFEEIKLSLIQKIKLNQNNKVKVAYYDFFDTMFQNEIYNKFYIRDIEVYNKITLDDVKKAYSDLMKMEHFYIYIGEDSLDTVINGLKRFNFKKEIDSQHLYLDRETKEIKEPTLVIKDYDVNQSNLFIGYRTPILLNDDDYYAMFLFNQMFGASYNCDLYNIVREEHGLAYSISSSYASMKGVVIVECGISKDNFDKTVNIINAILQTYQDGDISQDKLEIAKRETITGVIKGIDSINNTVDTAMNFGARGYLKTTNELIEKVNLITVEDIKRVANTLVLDTTYFMRGNK